MSKAEADRLSSELIEVSETADTCKFTAYLRVMDPVALDNRAAEPVELQLAAAIRTRAALLAAEADRLVGLLASRLQPRPAKPRWS
jgi:hypothetical protein